MYVSHLCHMNKCVQNWHFSCDGMIKCDPILTLWNPSRKFVTCDTSEYTWAFPMTMCSGQKPKHQLNKNIKPNFSIASHFTIYSWFKDISKYFKISLIELEISLIHFKISLNQLKISQNHFKMFLNTLKMPLIHL